jgi:hypothetical protein
MLAAKEVVKTKARAVSKQIRALLRFLGGGNGHCEWQDGDKSIVGLIAKWTSLRWRFLVLVVHRHLLNEGI